MGYDTEGLGYLSESFKTIQKEFESLIYWVNNHEYHTNKSVEFDDLRQLQEKSVRLKVKCMKFIFEANQEIGNRIEKKTHDQSLYQKLRL